MYMHMDLQLKISYGTMKTHTHTHTSGMCVGNGKEPVWKGCMLCDLTILEKEIYGGDYKAVTIFQGWGRGRRPSGCFEFFLPQQ